jgi:putative exosortase-associated protein (TIGR04073 family)
MKKVITLVIALAATAVSSHADIQAPPGSKYTSTRKLGRAIGNILYGVSEIPDSIVRVGDKEGSKSAWSHGLVLGVSKAYKRFGYGWYELMTFRCPTYKGTFKPPYERCGTDARIEMDPFTGFSEFPPELGAENFYFTRSQEW